jgi:hypothetical protein
MDSLLFFLCLVAGGGSLVTELAEKLHVRHSYPTGS